MLVCRGLECTYLGESHFLYLWYYYRMTLIDDYLQKIEAAKRKELERIRTLAKKIVPDAEETINYNMPTLKIKGKPFLGFNVHKNHIGIYPYSGQVIETLKDKLQGYGFSSGAIRIPFDKPIPENLLNQIISCRLEQIKNN